MAMTITEIRSMYSTVLWPVSSRTKRVMAFMMVSFGRVWWERIGKGRQGGKQGPCQPR
jgi:hypothetical protein